MAASQPARPSARKSVQQFFSDAGNSVDQFRRAAAVEGRKAYEAAIRTGAPIAAKTEQEIIEMGAKAIRQNIAIAKGIVAVAKDPKSAEAQRFIRETKNNTMAAVHGVGDAMTLGAADHVSAGVRAAINSGMDPHKARQLYDANMAQERAQDGYEGEHYGEARLGGQIVGTIAGGLLMGPIGEAAQIGRIAGAAKGLAPIAGRAGQVVAETLAPLTKPAAQFAKDYLAAATRYVALKGGGPAIEATKMIGREYGALAGAGAASNVGSQFVGDLTSGHNSSLQDYVVAAGVGAAQGALAHRYGPTSLGAVGGAATSVGQDLVDGRSISLADALIASGAGAAVGHLAGTGAAAWSDGLAVNAPRGGIIPRSKGELGERMMVLRTLARGDGLRQGPHRYYLPDGSYTVPDGYIGMRGISEAKFGGGELSRRQQEAQALLGDDYRVDTFQPRDVGVAVGLPFANVGSAKRAAWKASGGLVGALKRMFGGR